MLSISFSHQSEKGFLFWRGIIPNCNGATALRRWETSRAALLEPRTDSSSMGLLNKPEQQLT